MNSIHMNNTMKNKNSSIGEFAAEIAILIFYVVLVVRLWK